MAGGRMYRRLAARRPVSGRLDGNGSDHMRRASIVDATKYMEEQTLLSSVIFTHCSMFDSN